MTANELKEIVGMVTVPSEDFFAKGIGGWSFGLEELDPGNKKEIAALGLEMMVISVFLKDKNLTSLQDLAVLRTMPCRWWLHGWAQSGSVTDEVATSRRGLSKVQHWLKANKNKAFIAPSSLGYGESEFSWETLRREPYKCGPSYYARGIDLQRRALKIPIENCTIDGFSTGGAAVYCLIPYGYQAEQLQVIAPAIFVKEGAQRIKKLREIQRQEFQMDKQPWFGKSARWKYRRLYQVLSLAATFESIKIGSPLAAWAYENFLSAPLMGVKYLGEIATENRPILMKELSQHSKMQIVATRKRLQTSAVVMGQLYQGISVSQWQDEWLVEAAKVNVKAAEKDELVPPQDIVDWQASLLLAMRERNKPLFKNAISIVKERLAGYSRNEGFVLNAGHSALDVLAG